MKRLTWFHKHPEEFHALPPFDAQKERIGPAKPKGWHFHLWKRHG